MPHPKTVYLISCVSKKRSTPAHARELYISDWFMKAREYVESTGSPWFILSAEHGLVSPERALAPYERTLNAMPKPERAELARRTYPSRKTSRRARSGGAAEYDRISASGNRAVWLKPRNR
jgi:hypothetical protein